MPASYTPAPRVVDTARLPVDGEGRNAASVNAALVAALDGARFVRDAPTRSWRLSTQLGRQLHAVAPGLGPPLASAGVTTVRGPVLCGFGAGIVRSPDGLVWREVDAGLYLGGAYSAGLGKWLAVGDNVLKSSSDTVSWAAHTLPIAALLRAAEASDEGVLVAVGVSPSAGVAVLSSLDGLTYADVSPPVTGEAWSVAFGAGTWVVVGERSGAALALYADVVEGQPLSFTESAIVGDAGVVDAVCFDGTEFVARSRGGKILRSPSGRTWTVSAPDGFSDNPYGGAIAADPVSGVIVAVGHRHGLVRVSYDHGVSWSDAAWLHADADAYAHVTGLCWATDHFVAVADNGVSAVSLSR